MERVVNLYWDKERKEVIVGCEHLSMEKAIEQTDITKPLLKRVWIDIPEPEPQFITLVETTS